MPINLKGDDIEIGFNGKMLLQMLNCLDTDTVTLKMTNAKKGMMINDCMLIMPVQLTPDKVD